MTEFEWITMDISVNPNKWNCSRCGESLEQPSQMRLSTATNLMKAFLESHKDCKEKKSE